MSVKSSFFRKISAYTSLRHILKNFLDLGFLLFIVSNQSMVGRGMATKEEALKINTEIVKQLKENNRLGITLTTGNTDSCVEFSADCQSCRAANGNTFKPICLLMCLLSSGLPATFFCFRRPAIFVQLSDSIISCKKWIFFNTRVLLISLKPGSCMQSFLIILANFVFLRKHTHSIFQKTFFNFPEDSLKEDWVCVKFFRLPFQKNFRDLMLRCNLTSFISQYFLSY